MILVDHFDSDSQYHVYCEEHFRQIPSWLIRWDQFIDEPAPEDVCEVCDRGHNP